MQILLEGSDARYTLEQLAQTLFGGEEIAIRCRVRETGGRINVVCTIIRGDRQSRACAWSEKPEDAYECRHTHRLTVARAVYRAAVPLLDAPPEWGMLSGVRPAKLVRAQLEAGRTVRQAQRFLEKTYFVAPQKAGLCTAAAKAAFAAQANLAPRDVLLYLHIPFCPSRCSYCSFVSMSAGDYAQYGEAYYQALMRELSAFEELAASCRLRVRAIYIGGGTPAILDAGKLSELCVHVRRLAPEAEFTVEVGRPDVIDAEKLAALRAAGVERICVNPQSLHDRTLAAIGRRHTASDFFRAFGLARQAGFCAVNVDLIAGLPGETEADFTATLDAVTELAPENITVHTLAVKRSSFLNEAAYQPSPAQRLRAMLDYADQTLARAGYAPYYLYRQKNMGGSFENVGFSRPGEECFYNICMMEEIGDVIALGAGASTKLTRKGIRRRINPKYPREYIARIDEILSDFEWMKRYFYEE